MQLCAFLFLLTTVYQVQAGDIPHPDLAGAHYFWDSGCTELNAEFYYGGPGERTKTIGGIVIQGGPRGSHSMQWMHIPKTVSYWAIQSGPMAAPINVTKTPPVGTCVGYDEVYGALAWNIAGTLPD